MSKHTLPSAFSERMKSILKGEYNTFMNELENGQPSRALFTRTAPDLSSPAFEKLNLSPVPFAKNGYYFDCDGIGNTPLHHAGAFYIQDPSAMATMSAVSHMEFCNILDCCASPGGKTLYASLCAKDGGMLVSNEFNVSRCKTLVGNIERFCIKNAVVTNYDMTQRNGLSEIYGGFFDLVICDAPCSGEGMFRKYPEEAIGDWSVENVRVCSERQSKILSVACEMVAEGGILLYSTCTFSLDENEKQIDAFLKSHPEFSLIPASDEVVKATADGYLFDGCDESIRLCRRFYPHLSKGEGQFIAVLRKNTGDEQFTKKSKYASPLTKPSDVELKALGDFTQKAMTGFDLSKVFKYNDNLVYIGFDGKIPQKKVFSCGVKLGEVDKNRFIPHHQLFRCFGDLFKVKVDLTDEVEKVTKYLHGEVIEADAENGWCCVTIGGFTLGGGKAVDGIVKNHYPKGLRIL